MLAPQRWNRRVLVGTVLFSLLGPVSVYVLLGSHPVFWALAVFELGLVGFVVHALRKRTRVVLRTRILRWWSGILATAAIAVAVACADGTVTPKSRRKAVSEDARSDLNTPRDRYGSELPYKFVIVSGHLYLKFVENDGKPFGPFVAKSVERFEFEEPKGEVHLVRRHNGHWWYTHTYVSMPSARVDASELAVLYGSDKGDASSPDAGSP
jgi:hypothetical protein